MSEPKLMTLKIAEAPTTGNKHADRMVNDAVDAALLRLRPIIRDTLRAELKRFLEIVEVEEK